MQVCISTLAQAFKVWNKICSDFWLWLFCMLGLTKLGLYWNICFFFSFTYIMQTNFHIHLTWWCGLVVEPSPSSAQGPGIDYRRHHHHQNQELIQICFKSDALGKMPSTLRISLKYISIKNDKKITNAHSMNFYTGQLWYTLTSNPWGGGGEQICPPSRFPSNQLKLCILTWSSRPSMLFGRPHCTWLGLADFPHCWHTKLETVITEINWNILTASLLIFLAKQPHRINTSSLCKAHE